MIDIRLLRSDPDGTKLALARRGVDVTTADAVIEMDLRHRELAGRRDRIRGAIKDLSQKVGKAKRAGDNETASRLAQESRDWDEQAKVVEAEAGTVEGRLRDLLLVIPNLPAPQAPDGDSEKDNVVRRYWRAGSGACESWEPAEDDYSPHQRVPHWEAGLELGILDLERGAKLSGSMFPMYRGAGATLLRALTSFALDRHSDAFEEIRPPSLVRTETMVSTGHLPKFSDDAYHVERDDLWAIPTAEVPLTSLGRDEILRQDDLPLRLCAATACFRREAGSAGRDTRGVLRVHEFDKVEILAYTTPEQAPDEHANLLSRAESLLQELGLSYRLVDLCAGDLGQSAARTFDLEVYSPGCGLWLEVSSVSWFGDYQARRANLRYRPHDGSRPAFVHTLNGSALAWPRIWAALIETHRRANGSVDVPECLRAYMRGMATISSK
ncbi:MAG: serine--tRNA ligase [Acidimicrobiales bacterium]